MNNNFFRTVLIALIVIIVAWCGISTWKSYRPNTNGPRQAIFLGDGQTYFGYVSSLNNKTVTLVDVYFLRPQTATSSATPIDLQKVDLIKLGLGGSDDIIGSKDKMVINRDAIKYVQDMRDDSQVNQKIADYLKNKK